MHVKKTPQPPMQSSRMVEHDGERCFRTEGALAKAQGVHVNTVKRWVYEGRIRVHRPLGNAAGNPCLIPEKQVFPEVKRTRPRKA